MNEYIAAPRNASRSKTWIMFTRCGLLRLVALDTGRNHRRILGVVDDIPAHPTLLGRPGEGATPELEDENRLVPLTKRRQLGRMGGRVRVVRVVVEPHDVEQLPVHRLQVRGRAVRDPAAEVLARDRHHLVDVHGKSTMDPRPIGIGVSQVLDAFVEVGARHNARREEHELAPDDQDDLGIVPLAQSLCGAGGLAELFQRVLLWTVERARLERDGQPTRQRLLGGLSQPLHLAAENADPVGVQALVDGLELLPQLAAIPGRAAVLTSEDRARVVRDSSQIHRHDADFSASADLANPSGG